MTSLEKVLAVQSTGIAFSQLEGAILNLQAAAALAGEESIAYEYLADAIKACNDAAEVVGRAEAEIREL